MLLAAVAVMAVALVGPVPAFAHRYFWVHMVQHLLLTLIAAPLFLLGDPVGALARMTSGSTRRTIMRLVTSRAMSIVTHPLVSWSVFALVMWLVHFSPLYEAALENEPLHILEHGLFLTAGILFWMPVIGADPVSRRRLTWPARLGYLVAALPFQSFLGLALYSSERPLYEGYENLADQRLGATIMWLGGDLVFVVALALTVGGWMRADRAEAAAAS